MKESIANRIKAENRHHDLVFREADDALIAEADQSMKEMFAAEAKARDALVRAKDEEAAATNATVIAYQKNRVARAKASEAVVAAEEALASAKKKAADEERAAAEKIAKERAEQRAAESARQEAEIFARLDSEKAAAGQALADALYERAEGNREKMLDIGHAVLDIDREIKRIDKRIAERDRLEERLRSGELADARHTNGSFGPFDYGGRSNGEWNGADDMRRGRFADRAARDAEKAARRDRANEARWERIGRQSRQMTSDADKKFYREWGQVRNRRAAAEEDERRRADLSGKRDQYIKEARDLLQDIKDDLAAANRVG